MNAPPFSAACERNREPILAVLRDRFGGCRRVLEIGSGTGQHAVHFAAALPQLTWQTTDRADNLPGIRAWLAAAALPNTPPPREFDVARDRAPLDPALRDRAAAADVAPRESMPFDAAPYDAVFSANTLHIMSWHEVEQLFARLPGLTAAHALLAVYGPFNYAGAFTSDSNAAFDASLKRQAPHMGIRDAEAVDALARKAGFVLIDDVAMPANNHTRIWQRQE